MSKESIPPVTSYELNGVIEKTLERIIDMNEHKSKKPSEQIWKGRTDKQKVALVRTMKIRDLKMVWHKARNIFQDQQNIDMCQTICDNELARLGSETCKDKMIRESLELQQEIEKSYKDQDPT